MSNNQRLPYQQAMSIALDVLAWLYPLCDKVQVAGSLRRQAQTVGDIEIVALPHHLPALLQRLDRLVENGTIEKALYSDKQMTRWGERLRCFDYRNVRVELAIADGDNYGYLLWLRTGPADGNKFVVTRMMVEKAAMRFNDGYGWLTDYAGDTPLYQHKLSLPDEAALFEALGMDVIDPRWRSEALYKAEWRGVQPRFALEGMKVPELRQKTMF